MLYNSYLAGFLISWLSGNSKVTMARKLFKLHVEKGTSSYEMTLRTSDKGEEDNTASKEDLAGFEVTAGMCPGCCYFVFVFYLFTYLKS